MSQKNTNQNQSDMASGFMDKLRDMIFEQTPPPNAPAAVMAGVASMPPIQASGVATNENMIKEITAIVMGKTTPYTALLEAITPLESYIPDEANRYRAAFALVGKTRTVEQIVQSLDLHHMGALDAEIQRFTEQAKKENTNQIQSRTDQSKELRQKIQQNAATVDEIRKQAEIRIQELIKQSVDSELLVRELEAQVNSQHDQLTATQRNFDFAVTVVRQRLQAARNNVLQFLSSST